MAQTTVKLLVLIALVIVVYDLYVVWWDDYPATVSAVIYQAAQRNPMVAFAAGVLAGHLFWSIN